GGRGLSYAGLVDQHAVEPGRYRWHLRAGGRMLRGARDGSTHHLPTHRAASRCRVGIFCLTVCACQTEPLFFRAPNCIFGCPLPYGQNVLTALCLRRSRSRIKQVSFYTHPTHQVLCHQKLPRLFWEALPSGFLRPSCLSSRRVATPAVRSA